MACNEKIRRLCTVLFWYNIFLIIQVVSYSGLTALTLPYLGSLVYVTVPLLVVGTIIPLFLISNLYCKICREKKLNEKDVYIIKLAYVVNVVSVMIVTALMLWAVLC